MQSPNLSRRSTTMEIKKCTFGKSSRLLVLWSGIHLKVTQNDRVSEEEIHFVLVARLIKYSFLEVDIRFKFGIGTRLKLMLNDEK